MSNSYNVIYSEDQSILTECDNEVKCMDTLFHLLHNITNTQWGEVSSMPVPSSRWLESPAAFEHYWAGVWGQCKPPIYITCELDTIINDLVD
jgi:hypothetical protein